MAADNNVILHGICTRVACDFYGARQKPLDETLQCKRRRQPLQLTSEQSDVTTYMGRPKRTP
eukprot:11188100-Lingulodinium_polyedra.AAC.1